MVIGYIGVCKECTVSDEESGIMSMSSANASAIARSHQLMIVSKKTISWRTMLRGIGTAIALPLLDAMVPALTAVQNTAAKPIQRFGVVYHLNGIIYDK